MIRKEEIDKLIEAQQKLLEFKWFDKFQAQNVDVLTIYVKQSLDHFRELFGNRVDKEGLEYFVQYTTNIKVICSDDYDTSLTKNALDDLITIIDLECIPVYRNLHMGKDFIYFFGYSSEFENFPSDGSFLRQVNLLQQELQAIAIRMGRSFRIRYKDINLVF